MGRPELRLFVEGGGFFEAPRWRHGRWWVSDFYRHVVLTIDESGRQSTVVEVPGQPSGLGWLPDGSMVIASMTDNRLLRLADGSLTELADLTPHCGGHLNDLVVDRHGHTFVGNFGFDLVNGADPHPAQLIRVDPDGTVSTAAHDLHFPNGSVITSDGRTLIVGETMANRFTAFDLADDGTLANRRQWATFGPEPTGSTLTDVVPQLLVGVDGCSLDAEGRIWAADVFGARAIRVAAGGEILAEIPAPPGLNFVACQLGGADGRTLLLCAVPDDFDHRRVEAYEASLFTVTVDVPGARVKGEN